MLTAEIATVIATIGGIGLIAFIMYMSLSGNPEREAEEAARVYYSQHGRWPDDDDD